MLLLYQIGIRVYYLIIILASPFSRRARLWINGRRENRDRITQWVSDPEHRTLWMHVSSLGEFEQGRPILERWKSECPDEKIVLSFYSPSGFDIRKDYPLADLVFYLPLDTRKNMNRMIDKIRPDRFILVKYDFWPNLLRALHQRNVPAYLISARFRPDQYLFKKWGQVFRGQLRAFQWIFVQDDESAALLKEFHFDRVVVAGDSRVDAVMTNRKVQRKEKRDKNVLIGGSSWKPEEQMLARIWESPDFKPYRESWRLVIAPHDISEQHLVQIEELFGGGIIRYSRHPGTLAEAFELSQVILIDSIGLLSSIYAEADVAFIGGGFGKGIHNILEPAAWGLPVIFGPNRKKFMEAESLFKIGAAFPVKDFSEFSGVIHKLVSDSVFRLESGNLAINYMKSQMGCSDLIIKYLLGKY